MAFQETDQSRRNIGSINMTFDYIQHICTPIFTIAIFTTTKLQKQPGVHKQVNGQKKCGILFTNKKE